MKSKITNILNKIKRKTNNTKPRVAAIEAKENQLESSDDMTKTTPKHGSKKQKSSNKKKTGKIILLGLLSFFILCLIIAIVFFIYIAVSADKFSPDKLYTKEASILYDTDGKAFAHLGSEMREKIKYNETSEELINAIVATEDSRFFQHNGFDLPRFLKASFGQALGQNAGGASTLTMQVSKNQLTSTASQGFAGIKRKFTDIYSSIFQIESNYSKEQIFEFYINSYYLGSGAYGVQQAAKTYFNKDAKDLNLSEAAMIAGLFQSPVAYDPNINPDKTEQRRLTVLKLMKRHGYINDEEYNLAKKMTVDKIVIKDRSAHTNTADYQGFIDTVAVEVKEKTGYDPYSYSMKIYTTMNREKQDEVNKIMNGEDFKWENDKVDAGAVVLKTETGAIVAVAAGRNSSGAKSFNKATMMKQQIGSTAKPLFDYGPAIEYLGWNTYHPIIDEKYSYSDGTEINNWDGKYKGIITIRDALVDSRNIPALKTFQSVKNSDVKNFVTKLGLSPEVASNGKLHEAHAIGGYTGESPLTVAAAYAAFGNNGYYVEPHSFTKVEFDKNDKTFTLDAKKTKVMGKDTAYMVTNMLIDTAKNALGKYNNINGAEYAAKTGTTNFDEKTMKARRLSNNAVKDLWVAGYNPEYSIAVWYGYDSISAGTNRFGSSQNSRLFQAIAQDFFKSDKKFTKPDNVVEVTVEKYCGYPLLPSANTPDNMKTVELFKDSSKPTEVSNRYSPLGNVTNPKATTHGRNVTLTWKAIGTPDSLNRTYWSPIVNKAFSISRDQTTYLNYIMGINDRMLGKVVYNIYLKNGNGLTKVTSVSGTTATVKLPTTSNPTYVIKASYTNYGGCESTGTEIKVEHSGTSESDATITLNGAKTYSMSVGSTFTDEKPPVKVMLDGEDITKDVKIKTTAVDALGNPVDISSIGSSQNSYTITYSVSYDGTHLGDVTRTVIVS
ncbi:MAG: hypothetical protein HFH47_03035 [Bacilli bacterium]|nr:hypothetical protein [Bacilli bacterium]